MLHPTLRSSSLICLQPALKSLRGLLSLVVGGAFLKEEIAAGKEQDNLELGRRLSSNPDFQLLQPPKPQGGMNT